MNPEPVRQQLNHSEWFVGNVDGEENHLVTFLPISSSTIIFTVVLVSLNDFVPHVFELTQTQLIQQCQNQGFTDNTSSNQIKLKLMDILQSPKKISQFKLVDSNLKFSFKVSAKLTVSMNSEPTHVTHETCFTILQDLSSVLLRLVNVSAQYQNIQRDVLNEKQKCLDFLLRSVNDLDGGKKIISQWAPENSKNYESLQPSTENDIAKNLFNKGNIYLQNSLIDSLKVLLSLQEKIPVVSQPEEYKERVVFPAINKVYDDDFELQVKPIKTAQSNSHPSVKSEVSSKASITKKSAKLLPDVGNISGSESTPPERTNSVSTTPSTSSSVEDYPRKKRKFGKIKIKNKN
ncbi:Nej1p SKDI_12G2990 [Saccharomyces kudriavzevii IFO 1802]|uniref:Uncharacterized protein n=2 Tax=Saccharomyces kudriavzevii (strain ATCC MYA-4449 / AS 2.2408 / CBS 8840 / NBRC 1802 / NCYC 2889) TaxID=226230 RepID=A0AA35J2M9_SACK1|nr:uncharacterized protein SKDI_12G2990 [Saccharomyces kudriavzevii IFO 1802]EJT41891.1 NEJ1-like protein [Saccharomyces kudriavzevii IFO 1802]CAI4046604.1 hypothetical protein SKDI_12G2990 [Saccharomyces kudriavzevii IFO 1802]